MSDSTTFLLIEKNEVERNALMQLLQDEGYNVIAAGDADHYLSQPINLDDVLLLVERRSDSARHDEELTELKERLDERLGFETFIGQSKEIVEVMEPASSPREFQIPENLTLDELEKAAVEQALERHDGNRTHAARSLNISVRTLQRKLKAWTLERHSAQ